MGPEKRKSGVTLMWGGTFLMAVAILGFCIVIAMKNQQREPQPDPARYPAIEGPAEPSPEETPDIIAEDVPAEPEPAPAEDIPEESGVPRLKLDNLAGTLKLQLPFMDVRNKLPREHTCFHRNMSPAMNWQDAPPGTRSYAVFMEKRAGEEPFTNWILFNIPATVAGLESGQEKVPVLASGARHAESDHDNIGYIGPCESRGRFHYAIRVFALDKMLDVEAGADKYDLIRAMNGHIIDAAEQEFIHYHRL